MTTPTKLHPPVRSARYAFQGRDRNLKELIFFQTFTTTNRGLLASLHLSLQARVYAFRHKFTLVRRVTPVTQRAWLVLF